LNCKFVIFSAFYMDFSRMMGTRPLPGKWGTASPLPLSSPHYKPGNCPVNSRFKQFIDFSYDDYKITALILEQDILSFATVGIELRLCSTYSVQFRPYLITTRSQRLSASHHIHASTSTGRLSFNAFFIHHA